MSVGTQERRKLDSYELMDLSDEQAVVQNFVALYEVGHLLYDDRDEQVHKFGQILEIFGYANWKVRQMMNYAAALSRFGYRSVK